MKESSKNVLVNVALTIGQMCTSVLAGAGTTALLAKAAEMPHGTKRNVAIAATTIAHTGAYLASNFALIERIDKLADAIYDAYKERLAEAVDAAEQPEIDDGSKVVDTVTSAGAETGHVPTVRFPEKPVEVLGFGR